MAPFRCSVCSESFKTRPRIIKHALSTGHDVNHCCKECFRWFETEGGQKAHMNSPIHVKPAAKPVSNPAVTPAGQSSQPSGDAAPVVQLQFGGVTYTRLESHEQDAVFNKLSACCHSVESLVNEGYTMDLNKGPITKPKRPRPSLADIRQTPMRLPAVTKRRAVVLDCEMAEAADGPDELISLCAIDFLTGEKLVDSMVIPSQRIKHWRTEIHGIDASTIARAISNKTALNGWAAARQELWKHIDDRTILIGQTICSDFEALRLAHTRVVDSAMLAAEAVYKKWPAKGKKPGRRWGLQELCKTFLKIEIRSAGAVHDNLEDVLAAREVVLQALLRPVAFEAWADETRKNFWKTKAGKKPAGRATAAAAATAVPHRGQAVFPAPFVNPFAPFPVDPLISPWPAGFRF